MSSSFVINLAILVAKPGQRDQLCDALRALVPSTRQEPGCLDYTLFEREDSPGTFYMRESFKDQEALDVHFSMPYFKAFERRFNELLDRPLQLVKLNEIS
jgi:quinol monooxygenase YgiN